MTTIHTRITVESDDPERTALALGAFGFQPRTDSSSLLLRGAGRGPSIEIVEGRPHRSDRAVFYGVDVYSSNAELSGDLARSLGWVARRPAVYWASGYPIIESRIRSEPDALTVFAAQTDPRLAIPTRLDEHPEELHSDIVTTVWFIDAAEVDAEIAFWTGEMGLRLFEEPAWYEAHSMAALFELDEPRRVGGVLFCDSEQHHLLELLYIEGGGVLQPSGDGATGWSSLHFERDELPRRSADDVGGIDVGGIDAGGIDARGRRLRRSPSGITFTVHAPSQIIDEEQL